MATINRRAGKAVHAIAHLAFIVLYMIVFCKREGDVFFDIHLLSCYSGNDIQTASQFSPLQRKHRPWLAGALFDPRPKRELGSHLKWPQVECEQLLVCQLASTAENQVKSEEHFELFLDVRLVLARTT